MKTSIKIFRILTCVIIAAYTLLVSFHIVEEARYKCMKMAKEPVSGAYELVFDRVTGDAWFYIISGVVLLLLCAATIVFLFRKGWISAVIAAASAVASSVYGVCLNTQLSEVVLWREPMRHLEIYDIGLYLSIKPSIARLCIVSAVCYAVLCIIDYKKIQKKL